MHCVDVSSICAATQCYERPPPPSFNGSSALQRFERGNVMEIRNGIMYVVAIPVFTTDLFLTQS